jgi:hypothetical protein
MDANLMKYIGLIIFVCSCLAPLLAQGETLPDPTRPPGGFDGSAISSGHAAYPRVRGLQSVIISPTHCAAIIDGKTVRLGAKHGNETLIEVSERGVVMQGKHGRRALTLFPAVSMKVTEVLPQDKPATLCRFEQNKHVKDPAVEAGQKEKK